MDSVEMWLLVGAGALIALVTAIVVLKPFGVARGSGADHEGGGWAWIGANHRSDGDCAHDSGGDGGGGD